MSDTRFINSLAIQHALLDGMHDPSEIMEAIITMSIEELCLKFKHYGNSYTDPSKCDLTFWQKRLQNEVNEYTSCLTAAERKRKLANLFNLVWMAYFYELVLEEKTN